ncbi:MAG: Histidine--tRNA ligase [Lentisphaerae bacterium ADurb.BinA184]|nr:MAG: Histidine--tRNA ligase [Lentisphaerae bacterium ADurb.BinA184]
MSGQLEPLPGTSDIWEPEVSQWVQLERAAREVFARYGYGEVRTPVFERTEVFVRGIGDQTEVVQKEMYTFADRGGRSLTLRPEGTAGVMRALANQGLGDGVERRVFYMGPMFRGERPAAGRRRQFHQIGVEAVGRSSPLMDAECLAMLVEFLRAAGIPGHRLLLNTRGTAEDRPRVTAAMRAALEPRRDELCEDCRRRLAENVWRILDCKVPSCQPVIATAPPIPELLGEASQAFFRRVCEALDSLSVAYVREPRLVRGLDYYEHTVFEVTCEVASLGAQTAIAGGGRYRVALPGGGDAVAGVGFAAGVERLLLARGWGEQPAAALGPVEVYVAGLGPAGLMAGMRLAAVLRQAGYRVLAEVEERSLKAQMRTANRIGAKMVLIQGESELAAGAVLGKNMSDSSQELVALDAVPAWLAARVGPRAPAAGAGLPAAGSPV